jgi:hypothetical protein
MTLIDTNKHPKMLINIENWAGKNTDYQRFVSLFVCIAMERTLNAV